MQVVFIELELYSYVQVTFIAHIPGNVKGMVRNRYIKHGSREVTWVDIENVSS